MKISNPLLANKKSAKDFIRTVALCETWNVQQKLCSDCGPIALYAEQWVRLGTGDCSLSLPCVNQERPWLTHRFWIHIQPVHFWFFNNLNNKRSCVLCCLESRFNKVSLRAVCVVCCTLTRLQQWLLLSLSQIIVNKMVHKPWSMLVIIIRQTSTNISENQ